MSDLSLAVVIASYDGEPWITEQLQSIVQQTRTPDEIIVSDDGSSDRTVEIVEAFRDTTRVPIRVVRGPSTGPADNFWFASSLSRSDLIAWSDQDDWWLPRKLEVSERALVRSGATVVSHSAIIVDSTLKPTGGKFPHYETTRTFGPLEGDPWHVPPGFSMLLRREFLGEIDWQARPPSHQTGVRGNHDHTVAIASFATATRVHIAEPLAYYRRHSQNWTAPGFWRAGIRESVHVGESQYRELADVARQDLTFFAACGVSSPAVSTYFNALAERCEKRANVYGSSGVVPGMKALRTAAVSGVYGSRDHGRFRYLAFFKDVVEVLSRVNPLARLRKHDG